MRRIKFLMLGFQDELRTIFNCLPKSRQTLLFSTTITSNLQPLLEHSSNKAYFYEAYEGLKTVDTLKQQYIFLNKDAKEVYLVHILSQMEYHEIRSAKIFSMRLSALSKIKSGKIPILDIPTVDLVPSGESFLSRLFTVPLKLTDTLILRLARIRYPRDYVHRGGRTARAGRGGLAVSIITEKLKHLQVKGFILRIQKRKAAEEKG
ncbi:hypothetical protein YC2023_057826 [Brassica napus]